MSSQSPLAWKISFPRPLWLRPATAIATTPSPKQIRMNVPKNSAAYSPTVVERHLAPSRCVLAAAVAMAFPPGSTSASKLDRPPRALQPDRPHSDRVARAMGSRGALERHAALA
jgi:hypothetical protein